MGICLDELRLLVIRPTLKHLRAWSPGVENLLLGTAAQESQLGFHLKQGRRHGLGLYQIPSHTHREIWDKYLINYPALASKVRGLASQRDFLQHPHSELATNLRYATAIAWLIYHAACVDRVDAADVEGMAHLWRHYFHHGPAANEQDFVRSFQQLVKDSEVTDSAPEYTAANPHPPLREPKRAPASGLGGRPRQPLS